MQQPVVYLQKTFSKEEFPFENLSGAEFERCSFTECDFSYVNLSGALFTGCAFRLCRFVVPDLCKAPFSKSANCPAWISASAKPWDSR